MQSSYYLVVVLLWRQYFRKCSILPNSHLLKYANKNFFVILVFQNSLFFKTKIKINLLFLQNLLEKSTERETRQEYALAMIQCKVLKQLENLDQQKYDDEDISEDIKFLLDKLGESVQDLRYVLKCKHFQKPSPANVGLKTFIFCFLKLYNICNYSS